jgi:hypothetical protein
LSAHLKIGAWIAAATFSISPALAERETLAIDANADWQHQWTAMQFPARIGNFERAEVVQFQERETDISANYKDSSGNILSLYIFRAGPGDAAIWHDRSLVHLGANDTMFGSEGVQGKRSASFAPVGSEIESGLLSVLATSGEFRSTGIAIYGAGEWLVKARLSSRGLDPDGTEALLREVLGMLPKLKGYSQKESYLIEACLDTMKFRTAKRMTPEDLPAAADLARTLDGKTFEIGSRIKTVYCREGKGGSEGSVYRPLGKQDRYIIAFGDSGTSALAAPAISLDSMLTEQDGDRAVPMHFSLSYTTATHIRHFEPFLSLPHPAEAANAIFNEETLVLLERALGEKSAPVIVSSDTAPADQSN